MQEKQLGETAENKRKKEEAFDFGKLCYAFNFDFQYFHFVPIQSILFVLLQEPIGLASGISNDDKTDVATMAMSLKVNEIMTLEHLNFFFFFPVSSTDACVCVCLILVFSTLLVLNTTVLNL